MKSLVMSVFVIALFMGGIVGCNSLPFLNAKNQLESIVGVTVAGTYMVTVTKDDKVLYTETWNCTKDETTGKLTGCHKVSESVAPIK